MKFWISSQKFTNFPYEISYHPVGTQEESLWFWTEKFLNKNFCWVRNKYQTDFFFSDWSFLWVPSKILNFLLVLQDHEEDSIQHYLLSYPALRFVRCFFDQMQDIRNLHLKFKSQSFQNNQGQVKLKWNQTFCQWKCFESVLLYVLPLFLWSANTL